MVNRFGKVDDGTTVTDYDEEEIARKHTLSASLAYAEWNKQKINLIDTPGVGNFLADALAALTCRRRRGRRRRRRRRRHGPDRKGVGRRRQSAACRGSSSSTGSIASAPASTARSPRCASRAAASVVPIQLPIGEEKDFRGVVDLVTRKAFVFQGDGSGTFSESAVPAEMTAAVDSAREALIEMVAENDEKLMEHFFEAGTLTDEELVERPARRHASPASCSRWSARSALLNIGVPQLLDAIVAYLPSPADRPFAAIDKAGAAVARAADDKAPLSAFVWKTIADPFAGRITMFRVVSGVMKADSTVLNKTQGRAGAARPPDADAGQDADARAGDSRPAIWARSPS